MFRFEVFGCVLAPRVSSPHEKRRVWARPERGRAFGMAEEKAALCDQIRTRNYLIPKVIRSQEKLCHDVTTDTVFEEKDP